MFQTEKDELQLRELIDAESRGQAIRQLRGSMELLKLWCIIFGVVALVVFCTPKAAYSGLPAALCALCAAAKSSRSSRLMLALYIDRLEQDQTTKEG